MTSANKERVSTPKDTDMELLVISYSAWLITKIASIATTEICKFHVILKDLGKEKVLRKAKLPLLVMDLKYALLKEITSFHVLC